MRKLTFILATLCVVPLVAQTQYEVNSDVQQVYESYPYGSFEQMLQDSNKEIYGVSHCAGAVWCYVIPERSACEAASDNGCYWTYGN